MRYARCDLSRVDLVDPRDGTPLAPLYPLDRTANADGRRAVVEPGNPESSVPPPSSSGDLPPLLKKILEDFSATGLPPNYLPKKTDSKPQGEGEAT